MNSKKNYQNKKIIKRITTTNNNIFIILFSRCEKTWNYIEVSYQLFVSTSFLWIVKIFMVFSLPPQSSLLSTLYHYLDKYFSDSSSVNCCPSWSLAFFPYCYWYSHSAVSWCFLCSSLVSLFRLLLVFKIALVVFISQKYYFTILPIHDIPFIFSSLCSSLPSLHYRWRRWMLSDALFICCSDKERNNYWIDKKIGLKIITMIVIEIIVVIVEFLFAITDWSIDDDLLICLRL